MSSISEALAAVRARIDAAAVAAGRDPAEVQLVAVSKLQPAAAIREAWEAGQRDFGENYVQELVTKAEALGDLQGLRWHFIGHLQRNKARHVAAVAHIVHSVDSSALAGELGRRVEALRRPPLPVLVEVNVGGEDSKSGCAPPELGAILEAIDAEPGLEARGLMTIPPNTEHPAGALPFFERLRGLQHAHGGRERLADLSMGMTQDLEIAVAAGATLVRVGTAIFGNRPVRTNA
jgi:pyridoxal phosphate enzyme (YggS family)